MRACERVVQSARHALAVATLHALPREHDARTLAVCVCACSEMWRAVERTEAPNSDEWHRARRGELGLAFGASEMLEATGARGARATVHDFARFLVLNARGTPLPQEDDAWDQPYFRHGHRGEPLCGADYASATGTDVRAAAMVHADDARIHNMVRVTPDFKVFPDSAAASASSFFFMDAKCPWAQWPSALKPAYVLQVTAQMLFGQRMTHADVAHVLLPHAESDKARHEPRGAPVHPLNHALVLDSYNQVLARACWRVHFSPALAKWMLRRMAYVHACMRADTAPPHDVFTGARTRGHLPGLPVRGAAADDEQDDMLLQPWMCGDEPPLADVRVEQLYHEIVVPWSTQ